MEQLLGDERIRRSIIDGKTVYSVADLVAVLTDTEHPSELWHDLKLRHPEIAQAAINAGFEALDLAGVFRLVQIVEIPRAQVLRNWIIESAVERMQESADPELAILRTRRGYEQQGYSRQWIDQRLRTVSARHELTSEWYRRGVREGEQFRALTNEMMLAAFGFDVEGYRRYKGLFRTGQNLRDHMNDLELALTALSETTAAELARQRHSSGFEALLLDARETGKIIARTRTEIEGHSGKPIVSPSNHLAPLGPRSRQAA
jgi:hypothetical protein